MFAVCLPCFLPARYTLMRASLRNQNKCKPSIHQLTVLASCRLDRNVKLLRFWQILLVVVYFKDRHWISKRVYCISCSVVCKIGFCSEFPDILDNACKVTRRRRRRTQAMAKRYAFHASPKIIGNNTTDCIQEGYLVWTMEKVWDVASISPQQLHIGLRVFWKLWLDLCSRRWL